MLISYYLNIAVGIAVYEVMSIFTGNPSAVAFSLATGHPLSRIFVFVMGISGGLVAMRDPESFGEYLFVNYNTE